MSRWRSDFLRLIAPETEAVYRLSFSDPDTPEWRKLALREELGQLILHVLACYIHSTGRSQSPHDLAVHSLDGLFMVMGRSELVISWSDELKVAEIGQRLARFDGSLLRIEELLAAIVRAEEVYIAYDRIHNSQTATAFRRLLVLFALSLALLENVDQFQGLHVELAALLLPQERFDRDLVRRRLTQTAKPKPDEFIWMPDPSGSQTSARVYFIRKQEGDEVKPGDEFGYAYSPSGMVPIRCGLRGRIKDIYVHNGDVVNGGRKLASVILDEEDHEGVARWLR